MYIRKLRIGQGLYATLETRNPDTGWELRLNAGAQQISVPLAPLLIMLHRLRADASPHTTALFAQVDAALPLTRGQTCNTCGKLVKPHDNIEDEPRRLSCGNPICERATRATEDAMRYNLVTATLDDIHEEANEEAVFRHMYGNV